MTIRELIDNVELPRYNNHFKNGKIKNGNYARVQVSYLPHCSKTNELAFYEFIDLNTLVENNSPLLDEQIKCISPYIASAYRSQATGGLTIELKKRGNKNG